MLANLLFSFDARQADEGRSFLSKAGGGDEARRETGGRAGAHLSPTRSTRTSRPRPGTATAGPTSAPTWIDGGVAKNLYYSRYWAQKKGVKATPFPPNLIMDGGTATIEELIRDTSRGVLVTRIWYIRSVDPQTVLVTGLTRDGTFFIENGKIKHAIKNFRFNESPIIMLNNLDALGRQQRVSGSDAGITSLMPVMRIRDFTFTSLSDAV